MPVDYIIGLVYPKMWKAILNVRQTWLFVAGFHTYAHPILKLVGLAQSLQICGRFFIGYWNEYGPHVYVALSFAISFFI